MATCVASISLFRPTTFGGKVRISPFFHHVVEIQGLQDGRRQYLEHIADGLGRFRQLGHEYGADQKDERALRRLIEDPS
jgi:hypothetical protein